MTDYVTRINDFRLEVWETNKAHVRGLCKWRVQKLVRDLDWWVTIDKYTRYLTYDQAIIEGEASLQDALNALWCPTCITSRLEPQYRWNDLARWKCPDCGYARFKQDGDNA